MLTEGEGCKVKGATLDSAHSSALASYLGDERPAETTRLKGSSYSLLSEEILTFLYVR